MEVFEEEGVQTLQMGDEDSFSETSLTEKLTKLNSSQQTLSRWCISHREKAKQVVETWQALFKSVPKERRVSFLYLANDILQNSRRKGSEFVNEFWKVLPKVLKGVCDGREENCKKVASRLVDIWTERKVFGSRGEKLKIEFQSNKSSPRKKPSPGKNPSPVNVEKNLNPIKILKRDANSLRIKLAVGSLPEKILTAFQLVLDETVNDEETIKNCQDAALYLRDIENDVNVSPPGELLGSETVSDIQKQEALLQHGISRLEKIEANGVVLISQLREALQDQEAKLKLIQNELLTARGQIEQAANTRLCLTSADRKSERITNQLELQTENPKESQIDPNPSPNPPAQPTTTFANPTISQEESNRATAAAVAAKLAASTSSAQMLSSVLSSLVAEELMNGPLKRPKLEKPATQLTLDKPEQPDPARFQGVAGLSPLVQPFLPPPPGFPAVQLAQPSYSYSGGPFGMQATHQLPPGANGGYYGPPPVNRR
ncbi:regulation of nuclear pre-mRNA domain-containing protein 1B [Striga asiatica]|uniref:Regulation of nuclear pre-mRNA domain-containing protein 1B n=1 Tax=Striga asiatica TaxID=4170 RepID=A0A5A7R3D6_STRAF|nr:regulation of nuclear pre-mRNA domain-containing protein 1B [Striga asiatica]